jgi:hypothetical protein
VKRSGAWPQRPHSAPPPAAARGSPLLGLSLSEGKVHNQDPLCLVYGLAPRCHVRLNHGSNLLIGELASPWRWPLLHCGLPSGGLHLLPHVMSVTSLKMKVGFPPWRYHPWGNRRRGLSGRSVLHPWHGCDGSERSPRVAPSGRWVSEAPFPA